MKVLAVVVLVSVVALSRPHKAYDHLGCWKDVIKDDGLSFLPQIKRLRLKDRLSQIDQCAKSAIERGFPVFGIRNNSVCVGSVHASLTYMRYGPSTQCYNGTGGPTSMDFYDLDGNSPYHNTADEEEDGEKRNFIYDLYTSSYAQKKAAFSMKIPSNAAKHPLVRNGHVRPVFLQPLYKEIDEREFGAYKPPISGTNVLINPSFEQPLVNDPIRGWSCQGETDDPRGGVIARYTRENPKQGKYSGICLARLSEWAGPGQYIGNRVVSGRVYKFEGWTKILDRKRTGDIHNLELWIRFKKRGSKVQRSKRLARRTKFSQDYGWVHWHTAFEMPFARTGFQYVFIYFKGPKSTIDIVLDDIFLGEIPQRPDWKAYSDLLINRNRKRNIEFRVNITGSRYTTDLLPNLKLTVKQESHLFAFGAAVNSNFLLTKPKYRDFYLTNFQWAVLESSLKWGVVEPKQGLTNYVTADKAVDFLQAHNKLIRGHCVFWAVDTEVPFWVKRISNKQLKEELKDRITSLLGRYKGRFMQWDVNNEMLHGSYFADREGLSIRDWMYSVAGKIDPDVDLFVNDFDVVENGQLTQALVEEVQDLLLRGIPLDGIGVQGHFTGPVNPTLLSINAAGLRYRELLKQWTTHVTLAPTITDSSNAHFETRGFFGDYDVELELSNGLRSTQKFTLNPGNGPLFIYLHLPDPTSSKTSSDFPSSIANAHIVTEKPMIQNMGNQDPGEFQTDQDQDEEFLEFNDSNELTDSFKTLTGSYVGCFDNSNPLRQLQYRYGEHPAMTPDVCVKHCLYKGYPFAGLLLVSECFCGLYFNDDAEVSDELCKFPCQGDFRRSCGGQNDIAIYSTS
ncbi:uncharacterized protein LOC141866214 isoform X2 [Acropora palmata]|uniref:uncharacterized protein LOC141866214 isoform X2 n=1 Tax=Acropora palmata TaxID=6131 RepID=UPI003DA04EA1